MVTFTVGELVLHGQMCLMVTVREVGPLDKHGRRKVRCTWMPPRLRIQQEAWFGDHEIHRVANPPLDRGSADRAASRAY